MKKRDFLRIVPGFRRIASALDRHEAEHVQWTNTVSELRSQVAALATDNDRLRRFLNQLAFAPDACEGADGGWPLPSASLRFLVAGSDDLGVFLRLGRAGAELVKEMPARHGRPLSALGRVLDFGCGCGRVVRHLADTGAEIHGCDANPHAVRWCQTHLPFGKYAVNPLAPPLPYPDAHFGLVFAFSVFTHLPVDLQTAWMAELRRVIAPGGFAIITTHGDACAHLLTPTERAEYDAGRGIVRLGERAGANECATFHPPASVRGTLAAGWGVAEHAAAGAKGNPPQDAWLLRREG
jgi:SAM-dependent methyltransferase